MRKEQSYISTIQELEESGRTKINVKELENVKNSYKVLEDQYLQQIKKMEHQLAEKTTKSDDWAIADELNKTLRINLQALQLTQEELKRKPKV